MSEGSINLIFDKEQIKKGISEDNYIDYYNHVSQRLLHRARGNVPTSGATESKFFMYVDMSGKYLDHFQFSVYKGSMEERMACGIWCMSCLRMQDKGQGCSQQCEQQAYMQGGTCV